MISQNHMRKKIVFVTGEKDGARKLALRIARPDMRAIPLPTIRLAPKELSRRSLDALKDFDSFDYVLFTSPHAVEFFKKIVGTHRRVNDSEARIVAVGPATALACKERGLHARVLSRTFNATEMARALSVKEGTRILFPRSAIASNASVDALRARGAKVAIVPLYTNLQAKIPPGLRKRPAPDLIVFMSASSVRSFSKQVRGMLDVPAVVIGEQTAKACAQEGFSRIIVSEESTSTGIVNILRRQL
jgi:uroporphyrinogen-III synthase